MKINELYWFLFLLFSIFLLIINKLIQILTKCWIRFPG